MTATSFAFRNARLGVVERFVKPVSAAAALLRDTFQILHGERRIDHRGQCGGVGCDDQILTQSAFQPQTRHAETRILVGEIDVAGVESRFRNSPRHAAFGTVFDLPEHHLLVRLAQHAFVGRAHHQGRHQVFEHRTGPGNQRRSTAHRRQRAAQPEPMRRRNFALGDGDETGKSGLRGQQDRSNLHPSVPSPASEPNGKQFSWLVEQKSEVHPGRKNLSAV